MIAEGITSEHHYEDGWYLLKILCPKLYLYELLDKTEETTINGAYTKYFLNENGKRFWALLNKISINKRNSGL